MIRTIIIDDEPLATEIVREYLAPFPEFSVVKICHDGFSGMKAIQENQPELIFLDIQMPKLSGFEVLELLENPPSVIFTTAYDEFALQAFDTHALDYLLKPFSKERFNKALSKFSQEEGIFQGPEKPPLMLERQAQRIVLKVKNEIKIIPFQEVKYFEANDDYVNIYTQEGKFLKNQTLAFFEKVLDGLTFVRVHRSYIVKVGGITKIETYEKDSYIIKLKTGETIPVSKSGFNKLKSVLGF